LNYIINKFKKQSNKNKTVCPILMRFLSKLLGFWR